MNDNDKNCKVNDDVKNCKIPVTRKEANQHSSDSRYVKESAQFYNRAHGKTDAPHASTAVKKRLSCIPTTKIPQIHVSGRKVHTEKRYTDQSENTASKAEKNPRSRNKPERKYSKALDSNKELSTAVSCKQHSVLKTNQDTIINNSNGNVSKRTQFKTNRKRSSQKVTGAPCKIILSSAEHASRREHKEKNYYSKKEGSSRTTSKDSERVDQLQKNYYTKKYLEKVRMKDKIELNTKQNNNNADDLEKFKKTEKINPRKIAVEVKETECKKIIRNGTDIKLNAEDNGAARTRIFKRNKSSGIHKNLTDCKESIRTREDACSKTESETKNPLPAEKKNDVEESKTINLNEHNNEQDSIDSTFSNKEEKVISLYNRDITTPESSTDCNHYQESRETCVKLIEETVSNAASFTASGKTSCKQMLDDDTKIDLNKENISSLTEDAKVCGDKRIPRKDEGELITESKKTLDLVNDEIKTSLTVSKIPAAVVQDQLRCHTNLINYGYHSNQQHCKRSDKECKKRMPDKSTVLIGADKNRTIDDNAKYDLMKALIQPAAEIHDFTHNNISKLLTPGRGSESVLTNRNEGLQDCYINSCKRGNGNKEAHIVSSSLKQPQDNMNKSESFGTSKPHTSAIYLNEPLNNTSDCIAINLKTKGSKHTKKYRHFKHEEKNMCCDMARYIKRIVSNERKYQEYEKNGNLEREEVKIIIDENSPKTSKIRILNDRSSVSVVCHSFGRASSSSERKIDIMANKTESSGGESSGYKSFHNNFNTRNVDVSDSIEIGSKDKHEIKHSASITPHPTYSTHYQSSVEQDCDKGGVSSSKVSCDPLRVHNLLNRYGGKVVENSNSQRNVYHENQEKRNTDVEYPSYDTKNYLSTFTNCMDVYLPCEIIAYQLEEKKRSKILHFNNNQLEEKDVDDAELHFGTYLTDEDSDMRTELSEGDESTEELGFVKDLTTAKDEVMVLKEPNNTEYESLEFVVNERLLQHDDPQAQADSEGILAVPAQYRIITSQLDIKSEEIEKPVNASHVKFTVKNTGSTIAVKSGIDNITMNRSSMTFSPVPPITTNDTYDNSETYETTSFVRYENENETIDDSNAVHELWTNKKSTADSTDKDSQLSGSSCSIKYGPKKNETNKFKFNIFKNSKSSASEKAINIPPDQLPKPPPSFLETSAPSQSTIHSSTAINNASESDVATEPHTFTAPVLHTNSLEEPRVDTAPIHYARKSRTDSVSNENINRLQYETNRSITHEHTETNPKSSAAPQFNQRLIIKSEEMQLPVPPPASVLPPPATALSPPASALPPPYPFCCPLVPYMMQYWQNGQQPPPAATVPLPEGNWKPTGNMLGSTPPPPGVVPIPWFPPIMHTNNPYPSDEMDSKRSNTLRTQPLHEWPMMPRGYAPCLPCSKAPESHFGKQDSFTHEDDEFALETSESNQDGRKKKVSNKLFKIFRRKNRAVVETLNEDDKKLKARYRQTRIDDTSNVVQDVQNEQQHLDDQSIWESPDIAGIVTPEEIGRCFRRGFRADGLTLSGEEYLCTKAPSDTTSGQEDVFNFSDHDTPLDFLLALGFSVDEATAAIKDDEVRSRFKAALTEARIWVPHIATTQGTLLYLLAMKAKPKVMRYFLQLVESIVNKRITNAVKLDAYLKILEKVEEGYVSFVTLFGKKSGKDDEEDTVIVEKQRRRIFYTIFKYAETESKEVDRPLTTASVDLLHSLAARYRPAIGPHLRLLACYIGEGLLTKDVQLEAALIYLSRLDSSYVRLADLEKYCGLPPSERRRAEQIAKTQS